MTTQTSHLAVPGAPGGPAIDFDGGGGLPADWYVDPTIYERELNDIFRATWQCVGHVDEFPSTGSYATRNIGPWPIVLVRGEAGSLKAFLNICRHRMHKVVEGAGTCSSMQCPYHAWTYGLDGSLKGAPRSGEDPKFDKNAFSMVPLAVDTWGPFVFVHFDPDAKPLSEQLGSMPEVAAARGVDLDACTFYERTEHLLDCNWKVHVDNSVECYHCPTCHPALGSEFWIRPDYYKLEVGESWVGHTTTLRNRPDGADPDTVDYQFYYAFPNCYIIAYTPAGQTRGYIMYWFTPNGPTQMTITMDAFFAPDIESAERDNVLKQTYQTLEDDIGICHSVQAAVESGAAPPQYLMPHEYPVRHCQELVVAYLNGGRA